MYFEICFNSKLKMLYLILHFAAETPIFNNYKNSYLKRAENIQ